MIKNFMTNMRHISQKNGLSAILIIMLGWSLLVASVALAHTDAEIGPYRIVVGWASEPPLVGLRNAITVEISSEQKPVEGASQSLTLELNYAGRTRRSSLTPSATPGLYTVDLIPTVRGQYSVTIIGKLDNTDINQIIEPEEISPASYLQFPETPPDTRQLQSALLELGQQLSSLYTLLLAGIAFGILGCVLAIVSLAVARRSNNTVNSQSST